MRNAAGSPNILYAPCQSYSAPRIACVPFFHAWCEECFGRQGSTVALVKLKFSAKSNRTLEPCLVHKMPP